MQATHFLIDQDLEIFGRDLEIRNPRTAFSKLQVKEGDGVNSRGYRMYRHADPSTGSGTKLGRQVVREHGTDLEWHFALLEERQDETPTPEVLAVYIRGISDEVRSGHFDGLNTALAQIPLRNISTPTLIAVMRATFPARKMLPIWSQCLSDVADVLTARGQDPDTLLKGML